MNKDIYKSSRFLYVLEAAFEYFISLLMVGAYLAKVTTAIGISDALTGILSSFVSLGCAFQITAIFFIKNGSVKRTVTILHTLNQLFFACVYLVPFFNVSKQFKIIFFIIFLLLGHIINNIVSAPKINWFMSLIDENKRGSFTASKEMVSLIGGMIFTFIVGMAIDYYEQINNVNGIFIFCSIGVFGLTILHTLTLIFSKEKKVNSDNKKSSFSTLLSLLKDKKVLKIILICSLWSIANYATTPFYGTYQIKELGFSMLFISILSVAYAVCRSLASKPLGRYADKFSFQKMLIFCFAFAFCAFFINIFTTPKNGKYLYTIHYILYAISMAGINSGEMNLIYDNVEKQYIMGALALRNTFSGLIGFATTLAISPLVAHIQNNGNKFLGVSVYAQQVVSAFGAVIVFIILICLIFNKDLRKNFNK